MSLGTKPKAKVVASSRRREYASQVSQSSNVGFHYELFELAHMLRVRPRSQPNVLEDTGASTLEQVRSGGVHLPFIQLASWHEDEFGSLLVLLCSNGVLLVWSVDSEGCPCTKQISWYQNPSKAIKAITLDPSGCWLVCACMNTHLYIVPVAAATKTLGRKSLSNCPWPNDDITKVTCNERRGLPCSVAWWYTADDFNMCIVGTELGEVVFVDLCTSNAILSVDLKECITSLEMMQDKQHQSTSVMISTVSGETWQLMLESTTLLQRRFSTASGEHLISPSVASALGYEMVGMMAIPLESFQAVTEWQDRLKPMPVKSAIGEVHFSVQHARNQVFIGAHNQRTDILQVYDSDVEHLPMFIYQLPMGTSDLILTDRLLFTVVHAEQEKTYLNILSSQLAETSMCLPPQQKTDTSSVIQTFNLSSDEQIVGMFKHTKTMEGLCNGGEGAQVPNRMYTVDGCVLVTSCGVYECRPRISPERLFLDLAINNVDVTAADVLAITTGLDVNMLYKVAAEEALDQSKYEHAMKLYQLSKCLFSERVAQFAKHSRIGDVLSYLRQALNKHSDFHTAERKQLSNLTLYCFVQQILECSTDAFREQELTNAFSQFINDNFDYDECFALELLASHGLKEHVFDVAKARGLMPEALDLLCRSGLLHLSSELLNKLAARGFTDIVSRSAHGSFLYCMDPKDAVSFLLAKPETILSHLKFLSSHLIALDEESLLHIARVLDPSRPSYRSLATKLKTIRHRTVSGSSMTSIMSLDSTVSLTMDDSRSPGLSDLLHVFLCCLLVLNHKREEKLPPRVRIGAIKQVISSLRSQTEDYGRKREGTIDMLCQRVRLSCGQQHTAIVCASGDVYTWGKSQKGRLGHGDLIEEEGKSVPFRVEILHMHRIKVLSVACGIEHTLALCRDGVYAWGSSEYGQVGQGDTQQQTRPVYITELSDKSCIAVTCGHYHSMVLTADQEVWAWGWGVHGQLGLGNIEDALLPSHVTSLDKIRVTQLAAGYSHTAVLNSEGQVYTFGGGLYGQLGLGTTTKQSLPRLVQALEREKIYLICCGSFETVAVSTEQKLYNWGRSPHYFRFHMRQEFRAKRSAHSQSASGSLSHRVLPVQMDSTLPSPIKEIHCGNWHYLVVTESRQVYTWGFNDHGQLGHTTKLEHQLSPKVVQKVGDTFIATASVGAEFSVVMDTTGQVFVWGRADSGQLGLDVGVIGPGKKEVPIPTILSSLPPVNRMEISTSSESLNSQPSYDVNWNLPDLSQIGNKSSVYGRESLSLALDRLYEHYSEKTMLRHCLDIDDYLSTSIIYDNMSQWSQGLGMRLKFLSQCIQAGMDNDTSIVLECVIETIHYSVRKLTNGDSSSSDEETFSHLRSLLQEVLEFWVDQKLPQPCLESVLREHLSHVAYPLSLIIFRDDVLGRNADHQRSNPTSDNQSTKCWTLQFSPAFLNEVLDIVAKQMHSCEHGQEYIHDVSSIDLESSAANQPPSSSPEHTQFTVGSLEDVQTSQKQLLLNIQENIKKDIEKCAFINLSVPTAVTVAAAAASQLRDWRNENPTSQPMDSTSDVIAFTCHHQFPRIYFVDVILPEFKQRMSELFVPLTYTMKTLLVQYKKTDGSRVLVACPVCVYNSFRAEQIERLLDSNSEGLKAKQWEI